MDPSYRSDGAQVSCLREYVYLPIDNDSSDRWGSRRVLGTLFIAHWDASVAFRSQSTRAIHGVVERCTAPGLK